MELTPLISVIIPLYNTEKYIAECLQSIMGQTYTNLDIFVINDASTDGSPGIVRKFQMQDPRIRMIELKENGGVANARNVGLDKAKGEYIAWCDSDDLFHHRFIETMYGILCKTNADFVECESVTAQDFSIDLFENIETENAKCIAVGNWKDFLQRFASHQLQTSLWSKLFKKQAFDGFRFPVGRLYEENYFYIYFYSILRKAAYITTPLYFYRSRPGSIMKILKEKELMEGLLLANEFLSFSETVPVAYRELFYTKTAKMLLNYWQRSVTADIPLREKFKWHKRISNVVTLIEDKINKDSLSRKERILYKIQGCTLGYAIYLLSRKLK